MFSVIPIIAIPEGSIYKDDEFVFFEIDTTEYIRSSRTIEILHLVCSDYIHPIYIYNYEGLHFHYFDSLIRLNQFFETGLEPNRSFYTEQELDDFLEDLRMQA